MRIDRVEENIRINKIFRHGSFAHHDGVLVIEALAISERFQISHFDAQIVAAAKRMGCSTLYSEDLSHGQDYGGVRVLDPFRTTEV